MEKITIKETSKFIINGIIATSVHFLFLLAFLSFTNFNYGVSNFFACIFGSTSSFLGNKYFVFISNHAAHTSWQLIKFILLYLLLSLNHGFALYFWSDVYNYNFLLGFVAITIFNTIFSYLINKFMIFGAHS